MNLNQFVNDSSFLKGTESFSVSASLRRFYFSCFKKLNIIFFILAFLFKISLVFADCQMGQW